MTSSAPTCRRALALALLLLPRLAAPSDESAYELGRKAIAEKDGKAAVAQLSQCVLERPHHAGCHWELGWAHFLEHDFERAKAEWETVRGIDPKRPGLDEAMKRIDGHLELRLRSLALRSKQVSSFNPRPKAKTQGKSKAATVTVHAVGDTMLGTDFPDDSGLPPEGSSPLMFASELLKGADITFVNHEGTLCDDKEAEGKCDGASGACYAFRSPPRFASLLKEAGFDLVSLANNHIMDFGETCRAQTEQALDSAGLPWSGRAGTVARFERKGVPFSMIAFHSAPHVNSTLDLETARKLVRAESKAKRVVIVSFHGGAEGFGALHTPREPELFMGEKRGDVTRFAHAVVDAGADLVLGSGPHVVRGIELYKERLIAYSLGNFATYKAFNLLGFAGVGLVLEAELNPRGRFLAGRIIPTRQLGFGIPTFDDRSTSTDLIRLLTLDDFPKTGIIVAQDGTLGRKAEAQRRIASDRRKKLSKRKAPKPQPARKAASAADTR